MITAETASLVIGLISLIGVIPVVTVWASWLSRLLPARLLLRLGGRDTVDVILTTSSIDTSRFGAGVVRATTGIGQVHGAAQLSRFLAAAYKRKPTRIAISRAATQRPENDLVLLGGPSKNEYSARFLEKLTSETPSLGLEIDDAGTLIKILDKTYDINDLEIEDSLPKKDIAIVIVWKNPFSSSSGRAIYCAGLTSYGTSGAATWFFNDVLLSSGWRTIRLLWLCKSLHPSLIAVLEVDVVNGAFAGVTEKLIVPIPQR